MIATGKTYTLENFVSVAFSCLGLDWQKYVKQSDVFFRPTDVLISRGDPEKAALKLGWQAQFDMSQGVEKMIYDG